ncbi:MAG: hypothetical protein WCJ29_02165 [bacterium]
MSAENLLDVVKVQEEFWVGIRTVGNIIEANETFSALRKFPTYAEAIDYFGRAGDEKSPDYVYTEHYARPRCEEDLRAETHFPSSVVCVRYGNRTCSCFDHRDVERKGWRVVEEVNGDVVRKLKHNVSYAVAVTFAHFFAQHEPGECTVLKPEFFRSFSRYPSHDCMNDEDALCTYT